MNLPAKKRPRRRFWQYSLRSLGLLLLLCAVLLGGWNHYFVPYRRQAEAIEKLNDIGAAIQTAPGGPQWLQWLFGEDQFMDVVRVDLEHHRDLKDEDLKCLEHLVHLKRLYLADTPVGDEGLKWARQLKGLQRLSLWRTGVTDAGMEHLARLENLEVLDLHSTAVTNAGIAKLAALPNLKRLRLFPDYHPPRPKELSDWERNFPVTPTAPMRAQTREILERAVKAATAGKPDLQRENLATLQRLAALEWPILQGRPYVTLQYDGTRMASSGGWLLADDGPFVTRLQWNLLPNLTPRNQVTSVTAAEFPSELSDIVGTLREGGVPTDHRGVLEIPDNTWILVPLGLAYAAAESGRQPETNALMAELLAESPGGLPDLGDWFVHTRLGVAITELIAQLARTEGDGAPHWRRFLAQGRALRTAFPNNAHWLDRMIEPLAEELAQPPPGQTDPLAAAVYELRDHPRVDDDERGVWQGPMARLVAAGPASIPYLIEALDDRTPTACGEGWYPSPGVLGSGRSLGVTPYLVPRGRLASECLERIMGIDFAARDPPPGLVHRWLRLSEGKSQADMLRNYLEVFKIAGYDKHTRFRAWELIAQLEGPEALSELAKAFPYDAGFWHDLSGQFGITNAIGTAFENLRADRLQPVDIEHLIRHGDRETYQQLAALAEREGGTSALLPHLTKQHLQEAVLVGRNWSIPLLAAALKRTEPTVDADIPSSMAYDAAVYLAQLARVGFEVDVPVGQLLAGAIGDGVFRYNQNGELVIVDSRDDAATRQAALRAARAWWLESGRETLAEVVARDHPRRYEVGDLPWAAEKVDAVVAALTDGDTAARREAISGVKQVYTYPVQRALLTALERETDADLRLEMMAIVNSSARVWHLPVLTARLADRAEDPRLRLAVADALSTIRYQRMRERHARLETWEAALVTLRTVLSDRRQPLELRRRAFEILACWRDPVDTPLLTGINDGIAQSLRDGP